MAITIIVTNAGRAALVNAANTGTNAVTITQLGITATAFAADPAQVALPGEIKRIASVAGVVVADDAIHVTASDVTTDAYTMRGFALYLADGTLFALYGQAGAILNKTAESMMLLAADIAFADIDATMIEFGDTNFILPPATTEILGLVELATTAEGQAGGDNSRVLTPYVGKQSVLGWLLSQDGAGSGLDADLLDGLHASAFALAGHTHGTMATQNANVVAITGGALGNVSVGVVDGTAGAPGLFWNADTDVGLFRAGANALGISTAGTERMRIGPDGKVTLNGATPNYLFNAASSNPARGILADVANIAAADLNGAMLSFTQNTINNWCIGQAPGVDAFAIYRGRNGAADGTEIARFDASGNFGIGTTTPGARLQIAGTAGSSVISLLETGVRNWAIRSGGAASNIFDIADLTAGATRLAITSTGRVGIGTAAPGANLHSVAADGSNLFAVSGSTRGLRVTSDANSISITGVDNTLSGSFQPLTLGGSELRFGTASFGEVMRISSTGLVGIGTTAPGTPLHVVGGSGQFATFGNNNARGTGNSYFGITDATGRKAFFGYGGINDDLHIMNEVAGKLGLGTNGSFRWAIGQSGNFEPVTGDVYDIGSSGVRVRTGYFATSVLIAGNAAWHAGNDGSGSGLDADLLDGYHGSAFARPTSSVLAATGQRVYADGYKRCWGSIFIGANSSATVTMPFAFDTAPHVTCSQACRNSTTDQEYGGVLQGTVGTGSFTIINGADYGTTFYWEAKGA